MVTSFARRMPHLYPLGKSVCYVPSNDAAPPPWEVTWNGVTNADTNATLIIPAQIDIVPSANLSPGPSGWKNVGPNCCRVSTSTSFLLCPGSWPRWRYRTNAKCTVCCSVPRLKPCGQLPPIRSIWERSWGFSASCTVGGRPSLIIHIYIVWCPAADSPWTATVGWPALGGSSYLRGY